MERALVAGAWQEVEEAVRAERRRLSVAKFLGGVPRVAKGGAPLPDWLVELTARKRAQAAVRQAEENLRVCPVSSY